LKYKDDRKDKDSKNRKNDVNFYRKKWLEDEDTIDQLRNEIRDLKDQVSKLKGKK
jgi:predicted RNase H-like nuclease (RuvC/YqgF family)